jgi:Lon protease-like protein
MTLATVGTLAEIRTAARTGGGDYELLATGTRRFALRSVVADRAPFLVGQAEMLEESLGDADEASRLAWIALRRFARYLQSIEPEEGEVAEPIDVRIEVDADPSLLPIDDGNGNGHGRGDGDDRDPGGIVIPDDPAVLSHLLSGIVQLELNRRQDLLEAATAELRLARLVELLGRELQLLGGRLRVFTADPTVPPARRN